VWDGGEGCEIFIASSGVNPYILISTVRIVEGFLVDIGFCLVEQELSSATIGEKPSVVTSLLQHRLLLRHSSALFGDVSRNRIVWIRRLAACVAVSGHSREQGLM